MRIYLGVVSGAGESTVYGAWLTLPAAMRAMNQHSHSSTDNSENFTIREFELGDLTEEWGLGLSGWTPKTKNTLDFPEV